MARPPMFSVQAKQRIVLSVLRGECSVAEAARRNKCSETSIAKWRDRFVQAGLGALEAGAQRGPSTREAQLERELEGVMSALGEAHVRLRLLERDGAAGEVLHDAQQHDRALAGRQVRQEAAHLGSPQTFPRFAPVHGLGLLPLRRGLHA